MSESNGDHPTYNPNKNLMLLTVTAPVSNHFLISSYKGNLPLLSTNCYKCHLCKHITDDCLLTCANCVNNGKFCHSKHENCSNASPNTYVKLLNSTDLDEYNQRKTSSTQTHLQIQIKMQPYLKRRKTSDEILVRRKRLGILKQHILKMRQQLEKDSNKLQETHGKINVLHDKKKSYERKFQNIKEILNASTGKVQTKNSERIEDEKNLLITRRQRINEICKYIFPIEETFDTDEASGIESTVRAMINNAEQTTVDATGQWSEYDDQSFNKKFRIVASCLPGNGDYAFDKLLQIKTDSIENANSLSSSTSHQLNEIMSGLSHACQLINILAFYLNITLPFRLHQLEFNTNNVTIERLRADIAKLNANILCGCFSQGIPINYSNAKHTIENLSKLILVNEYQSRPKPIIYSQNYIDMIEREVNDISRAYVTDYWWDDFEKYDMLNGDDWETVPQDYNIPDDPYLIEHSTQNTAMSGSIGLALKNKSSLILSLVRSLTTSSKT
ncbi:unnamed protein product [Didymodactylos carnosus]|uniref:Beclin 1-associated autophagy-related key regulator n=1 Tax=Didymodactylos carnosus TaxID=1234261 RepID=A0A813QFV8_9BILA|nr:unnamed protein product [Didymodactylos carnosus]CAF3547925.1 unnamed protein product [Didymodactylos carnosus]